MHRLRTRVVFVFACIAFPCVANSQSLRQAADRNGILIGAAVNVNYLSESAYTSTLGREFNMIEPEDAMKWAILRPDSKTFEFSQADKIAKFAEMHRMKLRGHTLVWGTHNPAWLTERNYTSKQLSDLLHDHISRVVEHFRGKVFAWDVVNEAFDERGKLRGSLWRNQPGIGAGEQTEYIAQAFQWAHEADPDALLFYNDAEAEEINVKSDAIYAMAKEFREHGVPIYGIGFEMHLFHLKPDLASVAANFARFSKLGMQIHITELDVALAVDENGNTLNPDDVRRQAEIYRQIARICLQTPGCTAIQTWGFTDKYSWLGWATSKTKGAGLLFDQKYHPKPSYQALRQEFMSTERPTH